MSLFNDPNFSKVAVSEPLIKADDLKVKFNTLKSLLIAAGLSFTVAIILTNSSFFIYHAWLKDRPMLGITYLNQSLAHLDDDELKTAIERIQSQFTSQSLKITIEDEELFISAKDFSPAFDSDQIITESRAVGKKGTFFSQIKSTLATLWSGYSVNSSFRLTVLPKGLKDKITLKTNDSTDAAFAISDGNLIITPEKSGKGFDEAEFLDRATQLAVKNEDVQVYFSDLEPMVTVKNLESLKPTVSSMINSPINLAFEKKQVVYQPSEVFTWLQFSSTLNGEIEITYNQEKIIESLAKLEKVVNQSASPKQVSSRDESVIVEGKAGIAIDRAATIAVISTELDNRKRSQFQVSLSAATKVVEPGTQTIEAPNTPGLYPGKYIEVDLSTQRLYQYEGETLVAEYRVSTGKWSTPTPIGSFAINSKVSRAYSKPYNLYMPYWMAFVGSSYGLHELPEWSDGTKEGQNHLGTPVSHGCIRLGIGDAKALYDWAEISTPVVVHK